ncbi:MAG: hypothetical protein M2R45_01615 [Verrucomicrobia subdivision 3 bacterium]|nr:hypothetical protein [Limisphaerales bacterium]MCS1412767.1 hypothetical protein [Limisphaerales bacterium]
MEYGNTIKNITEFGNQAHKKPESRDIEIERMNPRANWLCAPRNFLPPRAQKGQTLAKTTINQLADLGFRGSRFAVQLTPAPPTSPESFRPTGAKHVEFLFDPSWRTASSPQENRFLR